MKKEILFKEDVRKKMFTGLETVYNAVSATLGPRGHLACIERGNNIDITKDGVTVAKSIFLEDRFENLGAQLVKNAAIKCGDVGDGPQPLYAKVLTPNGYVKISDLKIGDSVCRIDGTVQTVEGVYPKGKKDLYIVHLDHGDTVECCKDHLWTVYDYSKHEERTITTSTMIKDGLKYGSGVKFYTPHNKAYFNEKEVVLDPFLVGVLIGDGCFTEKQDYVEITIGYKKVKKIIPNIVLPEGIEIKEYDNKKRNAIRYRFTGKTKDGKTLLDLLKEIGLFGAGSEEKFIPKDYLINSFENRIKLLNGLINTDGYVNSRGLLEYTTISKQLFDDVKFLLNSLGKQVYTSVKENRIEQGAFSNTPLYCINELKGYKHGKRILSIEKTDRKEEMMCIKVSGEEELYITDNFTTTHNTTTLSVLAYALAKEGMKAMAAGYPAVSLKKGMEKAVNKVCEELTAKATKISSVEDIYNVALISSNNDEKIAGLVKEAFEKMGNDALITVEESSTAETYLTIKEGMSIPNGYISPYFVNNEKLTSELKDCYVLVTDQVISSVNQIVPILDGVAQSGKPLFIIADDITGEVLPVLIVNNSRGSLRVNAVKAPSYGSGKKDILQDIATLTGAAFISSDFGINIADASMEMLGHADKIVSKEDLTTIIGGGGNKEEIVKSIALIKAQMEEEESSRMKEKLNERLSKFAGGICVINVSAQTDVQTKELRDRVDDTICAVKASLKDGILVGGGISLLLAGENLKAEDGEEKVGMEIVKKALTYPIRKLAENADMPADVIVNETISKSDGKSGYNILTREWDNELVKKVVDPALVETSALKNALSVVSLLLNTDVAIVEKPEEQNNMNM